jgi:hypothetical protein
MGCLIKRLKGDSDRRNGPGVFFIIQRKDSEMQYRLSGEACREYGNPSRKGNNLAQDVCAKFSH